MYHRAIVNDKISYPEKFNYLPVSKISAFIGRHEYQSPEDVIFSLIQSYKKNLWKKIMTEYILEKYVYGKNLDLLINKFKIYKSDNVSSTDQYLLLLKSVNGKFYQEYLASLPMVNVNVDELCQKLSSRQDIEADAHAKLINNLKFNEYIKDPKPTNEAETALILSREIGHDAETVRHLLVKTRGTNLEYDTFDKLKNNAALVALYKNYALMKPNRLFKRYFAVGKDPHGRQYDVMGQVYPINSKCSYTISGRIDGAVYCNGEVKALIEIKNRRSSFFQPQYDIDQVIIYMIIHPELDTNGHLVEQMNGEVRVHPPISYQTAVNEWKKLKPLIDDQMIYATTLLSEGGKPLFDLLEKYLSA